PSTATSMSKSCTESTDFPDTTSQLPRFPSHLFKLSLENENRSRKDDTIAQVLNSLVNVSFHINISTEGDLTQAPAIHLTHLNKTILPLNRHTSPNFNQNILYTVEIRFRLFLSELSWLLLA